VRDNVDVRDLADAHVRAVEVLESTPRIAAYNVGRGTGSSVLEVVEAVREVTGLRLRQELADRRPGDPARVVGDVSRIARDLDWTARYDLAAMVGSAWAAEPHGADPAQAGR
jgi:UDP-glucose 4-epimerase